MSGWIFTIIGWLFSHTAATQLCSNTLIKVILHNKSPLRLLLLSKLHTVYTACYRPTHMCVGQ